VLIPNSFSIVGILADLLSTSAPDNSIRDTINKRRYSQSQKGIETRVREHEDIKRRKFFVRLYTLRVLNSLSICGRSFCDEHKSVTGEFQSFATDLTPDIIAGYKKYISDKMELYNVVNVITSECTVRETCKLPY